jgi:hypothetical protein
MRWRLWLILASSNLPGAPLAHPLDLGSSSNTQMGPLSGPI